MSTPFSWPAKRVLLTGGAGFLGSAIARTLRARGVAAPHLFIPRSRSCDLTDRIQVRAALDAARPDVIIHAAAAVGGIQANRDQPARFFHDNMAMTLNLVDEAQRRSARGATLDVFVQVGSMTSYPAEAPIPFREESLWTGAPEADIAAYGVAKLAAWQMLDAYHRQHRFPSAYLIPVNLYGPGDNIADVRSAHVAGSLIKRFVDAVNSGAEEVAVWGSGTPTREFLYIFDAAEAIVRAAERQRTPTPINLGTGQEISIRALAELIGELSGFQGRISFDATKPDGQARRSLDPSRARTMLDWTAATNLRDGLAKTIEWYRRTGGDRSLSSEF